MYYQRKFNSDSFGNDILNYRGFSFPKQHLHCVAELIYMEKGGLELTCDGKKYSMSSGQCAFILPNHAHSFVCDDDASFWVHAFKTSLLPSFFNSISGLYAKGAVFECDSEALEYYKRVCLCLPPDCLVGGGENPKLIQSYLPNGIPPFKLKAALYAVLSCYEEQTEFVRYNKSDDALFLQVLNHISENFKSDIKLEDVASSVGYETHYLCRMLKRTSSVPFRELVNGFRIDYAKSLLENTELDMTEIALKSGYSCQRTFNRVFLSCEEITPKEYRKRNAAKGGAAELQEVLH